MYITLQTLFFQTFLTTGELISKFEVHPAQTLKHQCSVYDIGLQCSGVRKQKRRAFGDSQDERKDDLL